MTNRSDSERTVLQVCLRAARAINRYLAAQLEAQGVTPVQMDVLDAVAHTEGLPLSSLREVLCCVGSNVTAVVDRMERDGLVVRRRDTHDRRVVRVYLGQAGRERLALLGDPQRCCTDLLSALDPEECRELVRILNKLTHGLGSGEDSGEGASGMSSTSDGARGSGCCGSGKQAGSQQGCCGSAQAGASPSVKAMVRQAYGKVGAGKGGTCCGGASPEQIATHVGYTAEELAAVPEGANLGLGCGNPTAIAGLRPGETVLDLGSGGGFDCFLAAKRVGESGKVIGVDMTPEMLERARENARKGGYANVEFRLGEIEALPVADASVDVVISNCVINLVPDKARVFREIARVLKPGGRMMVSDMVLLRALPQEALQSAAAYVACAAGALPREEYLRLIADAGLVEVEVLSEQDAAESFLNPTDPTTNLLIAGRPVEDIRGYVASISVSAQKA